MVGLAISPANLFDETIKSNNKKIIAISKSYNHCC